MEFVFGDNNIVESLDVVPESFRGLYAAGEGDNSGKFVLLEGVTAIADAYDGVSASLKRALADKSKASNEAANRRVTAKRVKEFCENLGIEHVDEEDPLNSLTEHVNTLVEQVKGGKELKINMDKIKAEYDKRLSEAVGAKDEELAKMNLSLERYLIGEKAIAAIAGAKGSPDLLLPIVSKSCTMVRDGDDYVVRVVDEQGDVRSDGRGGFMNVTDLVTEMKSSDKFSRAFESETRSGSGVTPGTTNNQRTVPRRDNEDMTPAQKIAEGLNRGKSIYGVGAKG